jgi:membrane protease YdiL (CAAX protease family)
MGEINILKELGGSVLSFCMLGAIVYILALLLKVKYKGFKFSNPRKSAVYAIIAVIISSSIVVIVALSLSKSHNTSEMASEIQKFNHNSVINIIISWSIMLLPILMIKKSRKETWASTGISKHNLRASIIIGGILGIVTIAAVVLFDSKTLGEIIQKLTLSTLWAFVYYAVVGFCEEFMFRGYLQIRLMEWLGRGKGWIVTSIVMALIHIPQRIVIIGLAPKEAIISAILLIPISLMMGYIMIKTENIVAPSIYHTFANWVSVLM